jgi:predicted transcriptional regulator
MIWAGKKSVEFRRRCGPTLLGKVWVYESAPVRAITGWVEVRNVLVLPVPQLWEKFGARGGIDQETFQGYFAGSDTGAGLVIADRAKLSSPLPLKELRGSILSFSPPQSYRRLTADELRFLNAQRQTSKEAEDMAESRSGEKLSFRPSA